MRLFEVTQTLFCGEGNVLLHRWIQCTLSKRSKESDKPNMMRPMTPSLKARNDAKKPIRLWHINIRLYLLYSIGGLQVSCETISLAFGKTTRAFACLFLTPATPGLRQLEERRMILTSMYRSIVCYLSSPFI